MIDFSLTHLRLQNQHLASPVFTEPGEIVKWLGAVQAQDYTGAKWAIGQRLKNANDEAIEKAFAEGKILRTHAMRPTWHFVVPEDIRWILDLTASRVKALAATRHRQLELDHAIFAKCEKVLVKAMEGGKQLERNELVVALQQNGILTDEQRFIHIMMELELSQVVCSGGRIGKQFTYALLEERVPPTKPLSREEALATLAERYFTAHGPATVQDFSWWSGLNLTDSRAGLEAIKQKLSSYQFEGNNYWFAENESTAKSNAAYLLPNYDEYIVSYKDRSAVINEKDINAADPRGTIFNHTIVINGKVAGIWRREFKKDTLVVNVIPFKALSKVNIKAVEMAAKRYAKFLNLKNVKII